MESRRNATKVFIACNVLELSKRILALLVGFALDLCSHLVFDTLRDATPQFELHSPQHNAVFSSSGRQRLLRDYSHVGFL